jgi:hypothetical protein
MAFITGATTVRQSKRLVTVKLHDRQRHKTGDAVDIPGLIHVLTVEMNGGSAFTIRRARYGSMKRGLAGRK